MGEEWEMVKQEEKYKKGTNKKNQEVKESHMAAIVSKRQGEKNKEHERLRILFSGAKEKNNKENGMKKEKPRAKKKEKKGTKEENQKTTKDDNKKARKKESKRKDNRGGTRERRRKTGKSKRRRKERRRM